MKKKKFEKIFRNVVYIIFFMIVILSLFIEDFSYILFGIIGFGVILILKWVFWKVMFRKEKK